MARIRDEMVEHKIIYLKMIYRHLGFLLLFKKVHFTLPTNNIGSVNIQNFFSRFIYIILKMIRFTVLNSISLYMSRILRKKFKPFK